MHPYFDTARRPPDGSVTKHDHEPSGFGGARKNPSGRCFRNDFAPRGQKVSANPCKLISLMAAMRRCALVVAMACARALVPREVVAAPKTTPAIEVALPARIDAIEIHGLIRTVESVVVRELPWRVGEVVSQASFDLGVTRLWNTPLFSKVAGHVVRQGTLNVAVFELEERWPLTPLLEFQSGGSATWFHIGASHRNVAGRYLELEGFYEYFNGQSGGRIWFRDARLFDERIRFRVVADRLMRPRPTYVVRSTRGRIELERLTLEDYVSYGVRLDLMRDDFFQPLGGLNPALPDGVLLGIVEPTLRVGRVDTVRLRDSGVTLETRLAVGYTTRANARVFKRVVSELNANAIAGDRWNFGLRAQVASVTGAPDELQFFIGGLDLLRGYVDNYFKATSHVLYNADVKFIVFDSKWLAMLHSVFSDGAVVRRDDGTGDAAFSVGTGVIFVIPRFADSQLRVDVALPLRAPYGPGLGFGSAAFF